MGVGNNSKDVVFLFGAGISIPIGIPAMEGIYKSYMDKKTSGISASDKKTCELFTKKMGIKPDLEEFLLAANTILEFKESGLNHFVENSLSKRTSQKKIKDYNEKLNNNLKAVQDVKRGILEFLSKVCFQFDRKKAEKINSGFVKTLSKTGYSVYSTNYDFAFEHVAIENNIKILDNFVTKGQRSLWNEKINFDGDDGFKLIKLHGSVTWYKDSEGLIEKIPSNTNINPDGAEVEKIVIVPTKFKDIYSQNFFALYSHFLSSLALSKVIVIAGHSLRDDYLRAAIIERKRQGNFQVIVIDPTYPSEIKKDLPPSRKGTLGDIIHLPYKWEDIADELSSILLDSPADKIASNCIDVLKRQKYIKNKLKIKGNTGVLRASEIKKIPIEVRSYLNLSEKPSTLRAWLKATYKDADGKVQNRVSSTFIEMDKIQYGNNLTGIVNSAEEISIKIPKIEKWFNAGYEVTLVVALVKAHVKKPLAVGKQSIAMDSKKLAYKA